MTNPIRRISVASNRLVLVEGEDERNLLTRMFAEWNIQGVQTIPVGGKDSFRAGLEQVVESARATETGLLAIGILRDADESPDRAFQSVRDAVRRFEMTAPDSHGAFRHSSPSVGIYILPDEITPGSIENLCWEAIGDTAAGQCSEDYVECLQSSGAFHSASRYKTLVHAYLSSREDPSTNVGQGAQKGYWPLDHPAFDPLKDFLHRLATI